MGHSHQPTAFSEGKGGRLQIRASDSVELIGNSADGQYRSGLFLDFGQKKNCFATLKRELIIINNKELG